jgi:hypothetical protein
MKTTKLSLAIMTIFFSTTNCSVYMAANQPQTKDVHVLDRGTFRNTVIADSSKVEFNLTKGVDLRPGSVIRFYVGSN